MLGFGRIQHGRLRTDGAGPSSVYGRPTALAGSEERDQLPLVEIPSESFRRQEAIREADKGKGGTETECKDAEKPGRSWLIYFGCHFCNPAKKSR